MPVGAVPEYEGFIFPPGEGDSPLELPPPPPIRTPPPMKPVVTGAALLGLLYGIDHWAPPVFKVTGRQATGWWRGFLAWPLLALQRYIHPGVHYVRHEVSKGLAHGAAAPAALMSSMAWRYRQTQVMNAHFADTVAHGFEHLVHVKTPQQIRVRTRPLEIRTRRLRVGEIRLGHELGVLRAYLRRQLERNVYPRIRHLEHTVNRRLTPEVGKLRVRVRRLDARQAHDHAIIGKIEWLAGFAGAVPLVLYAFRRLRLQSLLCRNTRAFTEEVCALPSGQGRLGGQLLRELIGDFMVFLGVISVVEFADELYGFLGFINPAIKRGLRETAGLAPSDYLGPVAGGIDLLAPDYLG